MPSGPSPAAYERGALLRVMPIAGGWRVVIDGLPSSDYPSKQEACADAEAYLAYQGRRGEILVGVAPPDRHDPSCPSEPEEAFDAATGIQPGH